MALFQRKSALRTGRSKKKAGGLTIKQGLERYESPFFPDLAGKNQPVRIAFLTCKEGIGLLPGIVKGAIINGPQRVIRKAILVLLDEEEYPPDLASRVRYHFAFDQACQRIRFTDDEERKSPAGPWIVFPGERNSQVAGSSSRIEIRK